ncbi:MAG TPA: tRNA (adenosine(37)-N6)-threonylcarbamoyltransferase complex dimerization subunit type 1 TsaB [Cyclobacteriaceae bacterium]|nr:tRNA (adenosine(37)-N6)-threonylcarbamoyltransferase complex dimerization subunit type 1 TsaB [Cyclobacteriaceae bacterium]HPW63240.1 tRNA (adenosine(37)-N6)-threonylcarbamoyltransferase complex dimerization subunit type 1 TsaB [Cyclobacteriaceae bacterium]
MALLLSLETSTQACSVALHNEGFLLASREMITPRSAASQLAVMIQDVLNHSKKKPSDLQGVVVASGPGSYTGLRIGVATAKGLCYALNIPLISINTLDLLSSMGKQDLISRPTLTASEIDEQILFCPMLDARRMEVYCKLVDYSLNEVEPTQAKILDEHSFSKHLESRVIYFLGEGAVKCREIILHNNARFFPDLTPQAAHLGELGYTKWRESAFEDIATFEPLYLKDFLIKKPNLV